VGIPLSPGIYEIYNYELFYGGTSSLYNGSTINSENEFSISFEILPGVATYMGRWLCYGTYTNDIFKYPTGCNIVVTDNLTDDKAYIHASGVPENSGFISIKFQKPLPNEITFP
jgi:hypothetical protein